MGVICNTINYKYFKKENRLINSLNSYPLLPSCSIGKIGGKEVPIQALFIQSMVSPSSKLVYIIITNKYRKTFVLWKDYVLGITFTFSLKIILTASQEVALEQRMCIEKKKKQLKIKPWLIDCASEEKNHHTHTFSLLLSVTAINTLWKRRCNDVPSRNLPRGNSCHLQHLDDGNHTLSSQVSPPGEGLPVLSQSLRCGHRMWLSIHCEACVPFLVGSSMSLKLDVCSFSSKSFVYNI